MPLGQGELAGLARVSFEAVTGDFNADVQRSEHVYRDATRGMSDEAIRLELSQDKLRRSLAKGPAAFREQARAELQVRSSERALRGETDALARSQERSRRTLGGLRGSLVGYAAAYLGGAGVLFAIRSTLAAAREEELVLGQTKVALEATGLSWERYGKRIETVIRAQSALGFDDEQLLKTFQLFVRATKDVDEALRLNALAADVARGRYLDLESASKLVIKASLGQAGALRRVGIDAKAGATGVELITLLTRNYGQAAEKASTTGIAAQDRLNVAIENTKEAIGEGLLPTVVEYTDKITKWLDTAEHQEELQRKVNDAVETGEEVLRGVAGALKAVRFFTEPVIDAMGGLAKAVELALILGIVLKARKAAISFGLISAASAVTRTKVVADAAAMGAALDVALRPRAVVVTGAGAAGGGGRAGRFGRFGGLVGVAATTAAIVFGPEVVDRILNAESISAGDYAKLKQAARQGKLTWAMLDQFRFALTDAQERELASLIAISGAAGIPDREGRGPRVGEPPGATSPGGGRGRRRTLADIQLDLARAGATAGTADDARVLRELRALYQRQIDALEARKNLTAAQKEKLRGLYGDIASVQSQLDTIQEEGERKLEEQRKKAAEKRRRARERELDEQVRQARLHDLPRARGIGASGFGGGLGEALIERRRRGQEKKKADEDRALTKRELDQALFEWLASLHGVIGQFGSNIDQSGPLGQVATHAHAQTELMREQNRQLERLSRGMWFPGTGYSRSALAAAGFGIGF